MHDSQSQCSSYQLLPSFMISHPPHQRTMNEKKSVFGYCRFYSNILGFLIAVPFRRLHSADHHEMFFVASNQKKNSFASSEELLKLPRCTCTCRSPFEAIFFSQTIIISAVFRRETNVKHSGSGEMWTMSDEISTLSCNRNWIARRIFLTIKDDYNVVHFAWLFIMMDSTFILTHHWEHLESVVISNRSSSRQNRREEEEERRKNNWSILFSISRESSRAKIIKYLSSLFLFAFIISAVAAAWESPAIFRRVFGGVKRFFFSIFYHSTKIIILSMHTSFCADSRSFAANCCWKLKRGELMAAKK